jgi:hypothetical protein
MSEDGGSFLSRWSKRKAEARFGEPEVQAEKPPEAPAPAIPPAGNDDDQSEIPLEDLPPIESIDASTDLTAWLRKKVPEEWKRAALSRVWASDPAISQFTGLADYAWDWNAPDGVPGFGPLRATDNVAELLDQAIGRLPKKETAEAVEIAAQHDEVSAAEECPPDQIDTEMPKKASDAEHIDESLTDESQSGTTAEKPAITEPPILRTRRGGGALPS